MAELAELLRQFDDRVTIREPTDGLIASGDLEVYAEMYWTRLLDALAEDVPKLHAALGHDRFGEVARAYLRDRPPSSFTLRDAGLGLADWLRGNPLVPPWAADLAALERALIEVFDGPDATPLAHADVVALGDALPDLAVAWVPASVVVRLGWAVDELWSALDEEQPPFEPAVADRTVLVWRRDRSVLHRTLDADEAELAPPIAIGARFADVCEVLGGLHGDAAGARAVELLVRWLEGEAVITPADHPVG